MSVIKIILKNEYFYIILEEVKNLQKVDDGELFTKKN